MSGFQIITFPVGVLQCNCSVLFRPDTRDCVVVDPGDEALYTLELIRAHGLSVKALWHTHAHIDHIGGTATLWNQCKKINEEKGIAAPKIYLYKEDLWLYNNVNIQASMIGLSTFDVIAPTDLLSGNAQIYFPEAESFLTPGHTPGSACLKIESLCDFEAPPEFFSSKRAPTAKALFSGDTLFRRSVGRTDLWGGNFETLDKSIRNKLYTLKDEYLVIPGHGAFTTLEEEKEKNPFVALK